MGAVSGTGRCIVGSVASSSAGTSFADVWVTGSVTDASSGAALAGVNITGSRNSVTSTVTGAYATYAPIIDGRVVVSAAGFGNFSSQIGSAIFHAGVAAYVIPLPLNPLTLHEAFRPASGLPAITIQGVFGRDVRVSVPPSSVSAALALPPTVRLSIAVVPPASAPGLMESSVPGSASNSTTLQSAGMFFIDLRDAHTGEPVAFPPGFAPLFGFDPVNFTADLEGNPLSW